MFRILSYIKFLLKSTNQHGVHSPFVYKLVTQCFYDKTPYDEYKKLKTHRNKLLKSNELIEVTDFGAGSKIFTSNTRKVSQMVKMVGISKKRANLLFRISHYFKPTHILELGTSLGLSTYTLHLGNPSAKITTVEGCPNTQKIAIKNFQTVEKKQISFVNSKFENFLTQTDFNLLKEDNGWHLIYFDGNHSKEATLDYFNKLLPTVTNKTIWIFDDIYWSKAMYEAWEEIKQHKKVTVTIDTYQWGIVFFRNKQTKEDFSIRLN